MPGTVPGACVFKSSRKETGRARVETITLDPCDTLSRGQGAVKVPNVP